MGATRYSCLSGYCVHNVGHNLPLLHLTVAELQSQSTAMISEQRG